MTAKNKTDSKCDEIRPGRVHYIDNLRWMTVSLLILFHVSIAYNTWGEANYIFLGSSRLIASIVTFIDPWFMPLMFLLAGVSSRFSLNKRGSRSFICERLLRLGLPLIPGLLLICPPLSYVADKAHNGWDGSFLEHYSIYFSEVTDLTGYDGGFTPGHLWFILALIAISLLSCAVIKAGKLIRWHNIKAARMIAGITLAVLSVAAFGVNLFSKPLISYMCVYLLGYYFFSDRRFASGISEYKGILGAVFFVSSAFDAVLFNYIGGCEVLNSVCCHASFASGVAFLFCAGHDHLDFTGRLAAWGSRLSYVFYVVHFPIVILCQYYLFRIGISPSSSFVLTLAITYPLTCGLCLIIDKLPFARVFFGLKG